MKTNICAVMLLLTVVDVRVAEAQSGSNPGGNVMVTLSASGSEWKTVTYSDGTVDDLTNQITVNLEFHPHSPQPNGYLFSSSLADFSGSINIQFNGRETEYGLSTTDNLQNQADYTETSFAVDTEFFGPLFVGAYPGNLSGLTLLPPTVVTDNPEPYRLFYNGTNGTVTLWISLPSPFIYQPYPSTNEAWTIPCQATVTGNGSTITGLVQDASTGKPLANATAVLDGQTFTTDGNGSFVTPLLPPGRLTCEITDPGYVPYQVTTVLAPFEAVHETFPLSSGLTLGGYVYKAGSDQPPDPSVSIGLQSATFSEMTTTDDTGHYEFDGLSPGTYTITPTSSGHTFQPSAQTLNLITTTTAPPFVDEGQQPTLEVLDASPQILGSIFLTGVQLPLDPSGPDVEEALGVLAQATTGRHGLVADGCSQVLLRFEADVPGAVTFSQANIFAGTLMDIYGSPTTGPIQTAPFGNKQVAFALYRAPDNLFAPGSTGQSSETDEISASFLPTGVAGQALETSFQLTVARAPVVLVHGLWDTAAVWDSLDGQLKGNGFLTLRVDYHSLLSAAGPFALYQGIIWTQVGKILDQERSQGFAATRADVVAHSMGGILTRLDANNPLSQSVVPGVPGCFRRIITIDTPHCGSRAASVLLDLAAKSAVLDTMFFDFGHPIDYGGVADLDPRNFAASVATKGASVRIAATSLPAAAICCSVSDPADLAVGEGQAYGAVKWCSLPLLPSDQVAIYCGQFIGVGDSELAVANKVFTTGSGLLPHDGIVPVYSQGGGCPAPSPIGSASSPIGHVAHTAAPADSLVDQIVVNLLEGSATSFAPGGFPAVTTADMPPQLCDSGSGPGLARPGRRARPMDLTRLIQLLASQSTNGPGDVVSVSVELAPGASVDGVFLTAVQNGEPIANFESTNLPCVFAFSAPTNVLGIIHVLAMAANLRGMTDLQETNMTIRPGLGTNLLSISASPGSFTFTGISQAQELSVTGAFSDGIARDITGSGSGTSYSSSAPGIASVDSNGVVTALSQGTCTVAVAWGSLSTNIPVSVAPQPPALLSTAPAWAAPGATNVPLTLIGSALGGATSVEFFLNDDAPDSSVTSTNLSVGADGVNLSASVSINSNAAPGLRTVAVTTPAGRSTTASSQGNRFFVGPPLLIEEPRFSLAVSNTLLARLHIIGPPGGVCVVQCSANLFDWTPVATNTLAGGDWFFNQSLPPGQAAGFYRAQLISAD